MNPKTIILMRHGESEGNVDSTMYSHTPDYKLKLTDLGIQQAVDAGLHLASMNLIHKAELHAYLSPYTRTRQTMMHVLRGYGGPLKVEVREDPRVREQDWGNLYSLYHSDRMRDESKKFGRFFYRMENGRSGADLYGELSTFFDTMFRDFERPDFPETVLIPTHGLTLRLILMRWFNWTVEQYEALKNPDNCEFITLRYDAETDYYHIDLACSTYKPCIKTLNAGVIAWNANMQYYISDSGNVFPEDIQITLRQRPATNGN